MHISFVHSVNGAEHVASTEVIGIRHDPTPLMRRTPTPAGHFKTPLPHTFHRFLLLSFLSISLSPAKIDHTGNSLRRQTLPLIFFLRFQSWILNSKSQSSSLFRSIEFYCFLNSCFAFVCVLLFLSCMDRVSWILLSDLDPFLLFIDPFTYHVHLIIVWFCDPVSVLNFNFRILYIFLVVMMMMIITVEIRLSTI
jgi:hypothetical protein